MRYSCHSTFRTSLLSQRGSRRWRASLSFALLSYLRSFLRFALCTGNYPFRTRRETRRKFRNKEKEIADVGGWSSRRAVSRRLRFERYWPAQVRAERSADNEEMEEASRRGVQTSSGGDTRVRAYVSWGCLSRSAAASSRLDQRVVLRFCQHSASPRFSLDKIEMLDDSNNT